MNEKSLLANIDTITLEHLLAKVMIETGKMRPEDAILAYLNDEYRLFRKKITPHDHLGFSISLKSENRSGPYWIKELSNSGIHIGSTANSILKNFYFSPNSSDYVNRLFFTTNLDGILIDSGFHELIKQVNPVQLNMVNMETACLLAKWFSQNDYSLFPCNDFIFMHEPIEMYNTPFSKIPKKLHLRVTVMDNNQIFLDVYDSVSDLHIYNRFNLKNWHLALVFEET